MKVWDLEGAFTKSETEVRAKFFIVNFDHLPSFFVCEGAEEQTVPTFKMAFGSTKQNLTPFFWLILMKLSVES